MVDDDDDDGIGITICVDDDAVLVNIFDSSTLFFCTALLELTSTLFFTGLLLKFLLS
ncbi:MAG: hypothetical protein VXW72_06340 [Candidatus Thermoplasmatota archaeon]|nr:hypothetical protein [Candidatus Thermoplasmatota archaeon]